MYPKAQIRILVVEDDPTWSEALVGMYRNIFSHLSTSIETAISGQQAIRRIRDGENFNLISCDINMGLTHPRATDGSLVTADGADGRSVLRVASEHKACNGIVVITGFDQDKTYEFVVPDEGQRRRIHMTLHAYLDGLFPGRNLYLKKGQEYPPAECVEVFKDVLREKDRLENICSNSFKKRGDFWEVVFFGETFYLEDSKGLTYIACLLSQMGKPISCKELSALVEGHNLTNDSPFGKMSRSQLSEYGLMDLGADDAGEHLDKRSIIEYRNRLKELEEDLSEADRFNDIGLITKLENEKEAILIELKHSIGLGGRVRRAPSSNEKARQAVYKRITEAIENIKDKNKALYEHLKSSIKTGGSCTYSPLNPLHWSL